MFYLQYLVYKAPNIMRLYLDEDVPKAIAEALRLRGYDVMTVSESGRKGLTDVKQLKYTIKSKPQGKKF